MTIYEGTTPTHTFTLPMSVDNVQSARIAYEQNGNIAIQKETGEIEMAGNSLVVKLTQEDTLKFDGSAMVSIQVRVLLDDGTALASRVMRTSVARCLDGEVLS